MKRTYFIGLFFYSLILLTNSNCIKEQKNNINNPNINKPPNAIAGTDQIITLPANSILLDGRASNDAEGTITAWRWAKIAGPSACALQNEISALCLAKDLVPGTYQFELKVTDGGGLSSSDTIRVIVDALQTPNHQPIASAGSDQTITLPLSMITLDGSGSHDPDNNISEYIWKKITGPASFSIANPAFVQTVLAQLVAGTYEFELKVTDNGGLSAKDTMRVTVMPAGNVNSPPVANAGTNQRITLPENTIILNGNGSTDPENNISVYLWRKITGPTSYSIANPALAQTVLTHLVAGTYEFELKVTDNGGLTDTDTILITVLPINQSPVANAGADQMIRLPVNSIVLNGTESYDNDGAIIGYTWEKFSGPSSGTILNPNTVQTAVTGLVDGVYIFSLRVTDASGAEDIDYVAIAVDTNNPDTINFYNVEWSNLGCFLKIDNINSYIPPGRTFKVYLGHYWYWNGWQLVPASGTPTGHFNYEIINGQLRINTVNIDCAFYMDPFAVRIVIQ